jgi:hypothetical protein
MTTLLAYLVLNSIMKKGHMSNWVSTTKTRNRQFKNPNTNSGLFGLNCNALVPGHHPTHKDWGSAARAETAGSP